MCFVWIWEQTAIISLCNINSLVCITETECVYCAVRTGSLYIIQVMCFVWIWEQTAIISIYNINWLVCITETECVYCAVRTGSLYIIQVNIEIQACNWPTFLASACISLMANEGCKQSVLYVFGYTIIQSRSIPLNHFPTILVVLNLCGTVNTMTTSFHIPANLSPTISPVRSAISLVA